MFTGEKVCNFARLDLAWADANYWREKKKILIKGELSPSGDKQPFNENPAAGKLLL